MPRTKKVSASPKVTKPRAKRLGVVKKVRENKADEAPKFDYHLEISFNDDVFKADANSLADCLKLFVDSPAFPFAIKSMVVLKYSIKGTENQRVLSSQRASRMFRLIAEDSHELTFWAEKLETELNG